MKNDMLVSSHSYNKLMSLGGFQQWTSTSVQWCKLGVNKNLAQCRMHNLLSEVHVPLEFLLCLQGKSGLLFTAPENYKTENN